MSASLLQRFWFLVALMAVLLLGLVWPEGGVQIRQAGWIIPTLVALVLGLSGFMADTRTLIGQAANWRAILLVFASVYIVAPLLAGQFAKLFSHAMPPAAAAQFFEAMILMAAQSSTMASAIALTLLARGNGEFAIIVALLTNLSTVLFTPLILRLALDSHEVAFETSRMMQSMALTVVLPVLLGQWARRWLWHRTVAMRPALRVAPQCIVLVFAYTGVAAAAQSLKGDVVVLLRYAGCCAALHITLLLGNLAACRAMGLDAMTRTAAVFAGAQKTLPNGIYLWERFFPANPQGAVALIFYHAIQLFVDTLLVGWFDRRQDARGDERGGARDF